MSTSGAGDKFDLLSRRHKECLRLAYDRRVTKEIAVELGLSVGTVSTYCTEAIRLLGARDRRDAAEQLHAYEGRPDILPTSTLSTLHQSAPSRLEPPSQGVDQAPQNPPASVTGSVRPSAQLLGIWRKEKGGNDLSVFGRFAYVFITAICIAIGFGAVATGIRVISDLARGH